ncbi:MAG: cytidylate kinase-like family protein [Ignavibacteriaceae bacterium]|jgi:hypothetical protein
MLTKGAIEKAKHYIESHTSRVEEGEFKNTSGPCITLSREAGAGAEVVGQIIIDTFSRFNRDGNRLWTMFDQNLIEKVLQDHNLPLRLSELMEERKYSAVSSIMNEILGGQPGTWNLFHKTNKTILQLAHMGYCIIVERGGNIITTKMDNCFHVRLIASAEDKIMHVMEVFNFNRKEAAEYINKEDENRKEFIQAYFHKNIEDPELYHLIVNTSEMNYEQAAELIYSTVMKNYSKYLNGDEAKTLKYLKSQ